MSDEPELVCSREGAVLVARLNRPENHNALSISLLAELSAAGREAEESDEIRALVLTGTGDRTFCAGMDLKEFAASAGAETVNQGDLHIFMRLMYGEFAVPVVAAVNGTAVGGGLEMLYGADIIVAATNARFGLPEVKRGLFPAGAGTLLGTRIPLAAALEIALTGDYIDAARAYELGLVNKVVEPDQLMSAAVDYAQRIAANGPLAVKVTKELVRQAAADREAAIARANDARPTVFGSADAREGAIAFLEKRPPVWTGR
jgi:enoyl-CoA hydratase